MIECLRDKDGNITAVCEWLLFNNEGKLDEKGETLFVGEFEINPIHRGNGVIKYFIKRGLELAPEAKRWMWFREYKYKGRGPRTYSIETLKRRVG